MNVEMFFLQADDVPKVADLVRQRLRAPADDEGQQPDWGLPSSYDVILAKEQKRKVALSSAVAGWMAGIESKEVLDFALLQHLSKMLGTKVIAVQLSEVSGCCGFALCANGEVRESHFSEDEEDPAAAVAEYLSGYGVRSGMVTFREAAQTRNERWTIL